MPTIDESVNADDAASAIYTSDQLLGPSRRQLLRVLGICER